MPRSVMDIFLSSTSKDLADCRAKVRVMVDRMRQVSIAMETFGARPATPLKTCRAQVEKSDALILIVGHRYGWVPTRQDGGDGDRSITWWEVHWALEAGKPVFAFLLDPTTAWTGEREQDRLLEATSNEEILAAGRAVKGLQEFRRYLERKTSRELFANADDLAAKVATSLHPWLLEHALKATGGRVSADAVERGSIGRGTTRAESADLNPLQYCYEQIHLLSALSFVNRASTKPVRLGLIAGRADASHPALSAARIQQITMLGRKDAKKADDYTTAIAGLLVGEDAGSGYQGVAQGTELLVLGVLEEDQSVRSEALLRAIHAACIAGVNVLCLPLGGLAASKAEHLLLKRAVTAGITVVCPAGNEASPEPQYPAAFPEVLAVGAVTPTGELAAFSSHGKWVDVVAPGVGLPVPVADAGYSAWDGTFSSCALAAGVVVHMLRVNPRLSPQMIHEALRKTATPVRSKIRLGGALVNACEAVKAVSETRMAASRRTRRKGTLSA